MSIHNPALEAYLTALAGPEAPLLAEVEAYTQRMFAGGAHMLSGRQQGRWLAWLSGLVRPAYILEIGTFTGYSALCLAEGLVPGGQLHTIDRDGRLADPVQGFFDASAWAGQLHIHIGSAADVLPTLPGPYDLVFIDADKRAYDSYLEAVLPNCRKGALILLDNMLWKGKVFENEDVIAQDPIAMYLIQVNKKIASDPRWQACLLPVRDGLWALRVL